MSLPRYDWLDVSELMPEEISSSGWDGLIGQLLEEIDGLVSHTPTRLRLFQVKEKFGVLRLYHRLEDADLATAEGITEAVRRASGLSRRTCFRCGRFGTVRDLEGWIVPMCVDHAKR